MIKTGKILLIVSVILNVIFISFLIIALFHKTTTASFLSMDKNTIPYTTAAAFVSFPTLDSSAVIGPFDITLKKDQKAYIQFSAIVNGRQANWIISALYDHSIISVEPNGYGITINAIGSGETSMQTVTNDGIVNIAYIKVIE